MNPRPDFGELAQLQWGSSRALCVGLDSHVRTIERFLTPPPDVSVQLAFNRQIVDATADVAAAYKPNSAFYEARGADGLRDLRDTIRYIHSVAPTTPVILDAKRADIGSTNNGYIEYAFDYLKADAITVHSYLGVEAMAPFLKRAEKGIFVLCRTSNSGAGEFQDLVVADDGRTRPFYETVAERVATVWNRNGNCGLVVGATFPRELARVRGIAPALPLLIPGVGAQGGDIEAAVEAGTIGSGGGIFINVSRSLIFKAKSSEFATAARAEAVRLDQDIRRCVERRLSRLSRADGRSAEPRGIAASTAPADTDTKDGG